MLGGFYPAGFDVEYSLPDAPYGITINVEGLITVSAGAELKTGLQAVYQSQIGTDVQIENPSIESLDEHFKPDENSVTVRARYRGETYTAVLFIGKDTRRYSPRYLGTIDVLPETADVLVLKGPVQGLVRARQGDYVLAVADGYAWQAGRVYQWTGTAWEYCDPVKYSDLYIRSFKDGLEVPELIQDMGWFGALFAQLLVAQRAFIETLGAQVIELLGGGQNGGWHYAQTLRSVWQSSKTSESIDQGEWGPPVRIKNERSDTDVVPVWLSLSSQNRTLQCDGDGNVLAGLLSFTAKAQLFKWNVKIQAVSDTERYPCTGADLLTLC